LRRRWRAVSRTIPGFGGCPGARTAAELARMDVAERQHKLTGQRKKRQPRNYAAIRPEPTHGCRQKSLGLTNTTKSECIVKPISLYGRHTHTHTVIIRGNFPGPGRAGAARCQRCGCAGQARPTRIRSKPPRGQGPPSQMEISTLRRKRAARDAGRDGGGVQGGDGNDLPLLLMPPQRKRSSSIGHRRRMRPRRRVERRRKGWCCGVPSEDLGTVTRLALLRSLRHDAIGSVWGGAGF
jgi:hypothetical protein